MAEVLFPKFLTALITNELMMNSFLYHFLICSYFICLTTFISVQTFSAPLQMDRKSKYEITFDLITPGKSNEGCAEKPDKHLSIVMVSTELSIHRFIRVIGHTEIELCKIDYQNGLKLWITEVQSDLFCTKLEHLLLYSYQCHRISVDISVGTMINHEMVIRNWLLFFFYHCRPQWGRGG